MKILVTELFLNHIPRGKEDFVLQKMEQFVQDYVEAKFNMSAMRSGVSVREIKHNRNGLRIFKLRINKGDRALFTFDLNRIRSDYRQAILFLDYCHHDDQAMSGRQIGVQSHQILTLNEQEEEERIEVKIDQQYENFDYDPNLIITRVINLETMTQLFDDRDEKAIYYLNDEQYECLASTEAPTFIFGSAGSGKTTINIHKAFLLALHPIKIAYFTYSSYLVEDAQKLFRKIIEESNETKPEEMMRRVQFHHFNQYVCESVNQYQILSYEEFRMFAIERQPMLLKQIGLDVYDIWKEIRGLLKGMIPKEWISYEIPISEFPYAPDVLEGMVQKNLVTLQGDFLYLKADTLYEAKKRHLDPYTLQAILLMHRYLDESLLQHAVIPLEIYLALDEQYCDYPIAQRELIYDLTLRYQQFLYEEQKVDENDLARALLAKIIRQEISLFDFVIADEIQDLTEIQSYCLIRLTRNRNQLLFSGDINQTIRPTYFHTGRIESILKTSNLHLGFDKHILTKNYRSTKEVVDLANKVVDLRIQCLGINKKNDYYETPIRGLQHAIYYLDSSNPLNVIQMIETGLNRHYVAIVVADEFEKRNLERLTRQKGAIFTVEEIKGIEKDYIICYNVMSKFKKMWEIILSENVVHQNQYRYYFNLLYVAITRARQHLCFIEEDMPDKLFEQLSDEWLVFENFDEADLKLNVISSDNEFYKEAKRYEQRELYEQAIHEYELAQLPESKQAIRRCQALIKNKQGYHLEAGRELMKIKEYEKASHCFRQAQEYTEYLKALVYLDRPYAQIEEEFVTYGIDDLLSFVYNRAEKVSWLKRFNQLYAIHLMQKTAIIDRIVETIDSLKR